MKETDLKDNFDKIQLAANEFLNNFGSKFTNTPNGHIATDIAGSSCVAGTSILRETVRNLSDYKPGSIILAEVYDEQKMVLNFITGVALTMRLDFRTTRLEQLKNKLKVKNNYSLPKKYEPIISHLEMTQKLEPILYKVISKAELGIDYSPYVAVLTAAKLVAAGIQMKLIDLKVGKEILFYNVILGSKTVPYPLTE